MKTITPGKGKEQQKKQKMPKGEVKSKVQKQENGKRRRKVK